MDNRVPTYRYTRQRGEHVETFTIDDQAATFDRGDGTEPVVIARDIPDDVVAATVVDLAIAGWVADA